MSFKKGDYVINDNGDVWIVEKVHRDGDVTITYNGASGTEDDTLRYGAGQMESWFRKLPKGNYDDVDYLDPKPYWQPKATVKVSHKAHRRSSVGEISRSR